MRSITWMLQLRIDKLFSVSPLPILQAALTRPYLGCIEYLRRFGYSDYQVYLLLSCAPVQGHVAGIVDIPKYGLRSL